MQTQLKILLTVPVILSLITCGTNSTKEKELEIKKIELEIKEKELEIREKELINKQKDSILMADFNETTIEEQKFEVTLGKTVNKFSYSKTGQLMFNGKSFMPNIKATPDNVPKFKISLLHSKEIAGAIAMDIDGQNFAFLLNLANMTAIPLQESESWNAAQNIYWSPSTKFMLAFCSYEGQSFISINTDSKEIVRMGNLKPGTNYNTWWKVDDEPMWQNNRDVLAFTVAEYCNPFEAECGDSANIPIAKFKVNLDAKTLKISKVK